MTDGTIVISISKEDLDATGRVILEAGRWCKTFYADKGPTVQDEVKPISYVDCVNAMMKMWLDGVLTDGEYNRIMDKLNRWYLEEGKKRGEQDESNH